MFIFNDEKTAGEAYFDSLMQVGAGQKTAESPETKDKPNSSANNVPQQKKESTEKAPPEPKIPGMFKGCFKNKYWLESHTGQFNHTPVTDILTAKNPSFFWDESVGRPLMEAVKQLPRGAFASGLIPQHYFTKKTEGSAFKDNSRPFGWFYEIKKTQDIDKSLGEVEKKRALVANGTAHAFSALKNSLLQYNNAARNFSAVLKQLLPETSARGRALAKRDVEELQVFKGVVRQMLHDFNIKMPTS